MCRGFRLDLQTIRTDSGQYAASVTVTLNDGKRDPILFQRGYPDIEAADTEESALVRAIGTGETFVCHALGISPIDHIRSILWPDMYEPRRGTPK